MVDVNGGSGDSAVVAQVEFAGEGEVSGLVAGVEIEVTREVVTVESDQAQVELAVTGEVSQGGEVERGVIGHREGDRSGEGRSLIDVDEDIGRGGVTGGLDDDEVRLAIAVDVAGGEVSAEVDGGVEDGGS